ncbi:MAG: methyl-accepting chemotaxis protein [Treponema sp.]|jgi:methyl-accepting chemotaxis protein|nr:methyl-accepting chemotaxis protein [Treponema sp.]
MTIFRNTKNSKGGSILPKIIFAPAAAVLVLGIQAFLVRGAGEDGAFLPLLAGGIVNIVILGLACLASCLTINGLSRRLQNLETLTKPLADGDYTALAALSEGPASRPDAAAPTLRESLAALGKFFAALEEGAARNREMKEALAGEAAEQDAVLHHLGAAAETIIKQFYDIEIQAKQGIEVLENLETCIKTLSDAADERSGPARDSGKPEDRDRRSRTGELSESLAERLKESADRAKKVKEAVDTGEEQAREANDLIKAIAREAEAIAETINIINKISEQTNILSMNAAIESAHAGQAGAGFAVVADEIRKLADSTKENAGRIHGEFKAITGKTGRALRAGEDSFQTFNGVSGETGRLVEDLAEIAAAAEAGAPNGGPGNSHGDNAAIRERMEEGISGVMAHYQGLKTALEQIGELSGSIRTGVREIHSGTGEILENHTARLRFLRYLEEMEDPGKFLPSAAPAASPAAPSPFPARAAPRIGPDPAGKVPKEDYSDSREVTVKKSPRMIS